MKLCFILTDITCGLEQFSLRYYEIFRAESRRLVKQWCRIITLCHCHGDDLNDSLKQNILHVRHVTIIYRKNNRQFSCWSSSKLLCKFLSRRINGPRFFYTSSNTHDCKSNGFLEDGRGYIGDKTGQGHVTSLAQRQSWFSLIFESSFKLIIVIYTFIFKKTLILAFIFTFFLFFPRLLFVYENHS